VKISIGRLEKRTVAIVMILRKTPIIVANDVIRPRGSLGASLQMQRSEVDPEARSSRDNGSRLMTEAERKVCHRG
jgi:hypothetical protein